MLKISFRLKSVEDGVLAGLPIIIGYIPIAMAFGILSKTTGISLLESFLFSALVYAGASQFIALNLLQLNTGIGEIIITTLLVNLRHVLMGASLSSIISKDMKKWNPLIAFGLTDEMFSVVSFTKQELTKEFILSIQFVSYLSWTLGTISGYLLGELLPNIIKDSMGVSLYAMFAAILIPEIKKSRIIAILAVTSGLINTILNYLKILPQGWSIVVSIILVSFIGTLIFNKGVDCSNE